MKRVTKRLHDPKIDLIQVSDDIDGLNRIIDLKSEDIINPSWTDGVPEDPSKTLVLCIFLYLLSKMSIFAEYYH